MLEAKQPKRTVPIALFTGGVYLWVIHHRRRDLLTAMGRVFEEEPVPEPTTIPEGAQGAV